MAGVFDHLLAGRRQDPSRRGQLRGGVAGCNPGGVSSAPLKSLRKKCHHPDWTHLTVWLVLALPGCPAASETPAGPAVWGRFWSPTRSSTLVCDRFLPADSTGASTHGFLAAYGTLPWPPLMMMAAAAKAATLSGGGLLKLAAAADCLFTPTAEIGTRNRVPFFSFESIRRPLYRARFAVTSSVVSGSPSFLKGIGQC